MKESHPEKSPLARLVLFIICLAIAGSVVAGMHYVGIDLPQQQNALQTPSNGMCGVLCDAGSTTTYNTCKLTTDPKTCFRNQQQCENSCLRTCACSDCEDQCMADYSACKLTQDQKTCLRQQQACENTCPC